jgi:PAS domain-containing protein
VAGFNRNVTKDGRVIHCAWYNSVLLDEHGRMASVMSLVQDLTEHRQALGAVHAGEERQRFLLELSDTLRELGDEEAVQTMACRMLAEHLGAEGCEFLDPDTLGDEALRRGEMVIDERRIVRPLLRHDELVACAEVRCHKGKYVLERVSASCCRRYAGSFNSEYYWRSITPTACELGGLMAGGLERFRFGRLYEAQDTQQALRAFTGLRSLAIGRVDALKEMERPMEMVQPVSAAPAAVETAPTPAVEPAAPAPAFETQIKAMQGRMDKMEARLAEAQKLNVSLMETVKQLQSQPKPQPEPERQPEPQPEPQAQPKKAPPARKKTQEGKS